MSIYSIMFLVCDHVTAKYFWIQPCKSGDGSDDQHSTTTHSVDFSGNACVTTLPKVHAVVEINTNEEETQKMTNR